jgi:hypothetical protein
MTTSQPTPEQIAAFCGCGNPTHGNLIACPPTPGDDGTPVLCAICSLRIKFVGSALGDYWAHAEQPADGHDAFPPNGGHASTCGYVGGITSRCTCA